MVFFKKKEKIYTGSVGGIPFFFSIFCLAILSLSSAIAILNSIGQTNWFNLSLFLAATMSGAWLSYLLISGKFNVLVHEFKHSFVSSLVGNKAKDLKITSRESGHFEYSFTKDTAKYNALISLAPYFLPLFSFPVLAISFGLAFKDIAVSPAILGLAYGMDIFLNTRDIGIHQTDFTKITGGFAVGLTFVLLMNLAILIVYFAWVAFQLNGFWILAHGLGQFLLLFITY